MIEGMNDSVITPDRWGLPLEAVKGLGADLHAYWQERRARFRTRTHDGSLHASTYLRGRLTMEDRQTFALIALVLLRTMRVPTPAKPTPS